MKTRSSSGVNSKIDLEFDVDTLRITDLGEEGQDDYSGASSQTSGSNVLSQIQRNNQNTEEPDKGASVGKIRAEADSTALRSFLGQLGNE